MAKPDELNKEASRSYKSGKYRDSALVWLQAAELARALGDSAAWYKYRVWAATSFFNAVEYAKAMDLFLEVRLHEPDDRPNCEAWIARKKVIEITLNIHPLCAQLNELMGELKNIAMQQKVQPADISYLEGHILFQQGQHCGALSLFQKAWQEYDHEKSGYSKSDHAYKAVHCCLKLGHIEQAKDWSKAYVKSFAEEDFKNSSVAILEIHLALAELLSFSRLPCLLHQLEDLSLIIQNTHSKDTYKMLGVRGTLLTQPKLDPMSRSHPAHQLIIQRLHDHKDVHNQYRYRLLFLDYRIAALRFCVGIAPVDDYYYAKPQQLPTKKKPLNKDQFQFRLQRALITSRQAERYGKKIDGLLECDWRQKEVQERRKRIIEIAQHYDVDLPILRLSL